LAPLHKIADQHAISLISGGEGLPAVAVIAADRRPRLYADLHAQHECPHRRRDP
jgi:hypothetical protein